MFVKKKSKWHYCTSFFQIKEEFKRITTVPLERTFLTKLDFYTPKMQEIFSKKGGVAGTKIRPLLDSLSQVKQGFPNFFVSRPNTEI